MRAPPQVNLLAGLLLLSTSVSAQTSQQAEPSKQESAEEEEDRRVFWDEGLRIHPERTNFRMKIGGQAQNDTTGFVSDGTQPVELGDGVEWRRVRVYAEGSFLRRWDYRFQWDFTGGGPNLTDAWLGLRFSLLGLRMRVRSGRFSSTFGLENDASSNDTLFMEQGLTSAFVPPQETGVLVHSESNRRRWDVSFSSSASELECVICNVVGVSGRYSTSFTFGREDRRLHLGGNISRRWTGEADNISVRPESHIAPVFVDTGQVVSDRVDTALTEVAYLSGPFSLQSETAFAWLERKESDSPLFYAFYVSGSYALTGESRPYSESGGTIQRIQPSREFRDGTGGLGALEAAFRVSHIDLNDEDVTGGALTNLSAALNWYPLHSVRASFNVIRADRESWDPVWIFQGRLQVAF